MANRGLNFQHMKYDCYISLQVYVNSTSVYFIALNPSATKRERNYLKSGLLFCVNWTYAVRQIDMALPSLALLVAVASQSVVSSQSVSR